mmetsp:Transcript_63123/g.137248  ORF Transcript_63123/g.137248 Transcript_63123/m.137248 type:complete len:412 (+) Transcript_63123:208-1443(+)
MAPPLDEQPSGRRLTPPATTLDTDVIDRIQQRVRELRTELLWGFRHADESKVGRIRPAEWRQTMGAVLQLDIPWFKIQRRLVELEGDGLIDYNAFLSGYDMRSGQTATGWEDEVLADIYQRLLDAQLTLEETLEAFDPSGDGRVSRREFYELSQKLHLDVTAAQVDELLGQIGQTPGVGGYDVHECIKSLQVGYTAARRKEQDSETSEWITALLTAISSAIQCSMGSKAGFVDAFRSFDKGGTGFISYEEFSAAVRELPERCHGKCGEYLGRLVGPASDKMLTCLAQEVDATNAGYISYLEFVAAFRDGSGDHTGDGATHGGIVQQILRTLATHKAMLRRALGAIDREADGYVQRVGLRAAIGVVNRILANPEPPLSKRQISLVVDHADCDAQGRVNYEDWLDALVVQPQL